jgi:hypothetical protein
MAKQTLTKAERKAQRFATGVLCKDKHLTSQEQKDECNINRILDSKKHGMSLGHLANYGGQYGDFSNFNERNFEDMQNTMARAKTIFNDLPAELRKEFDNNVGAFFGFVNNPENKDRLQELFPALARPGMQLPDVVGGGNAFGKAAAEAMAQTLGIEAVKPSDEENAEGGKGGEAAK